jgi:hypothetical protein
MKNEKLKTLTIKNTFCKECGWYSSGTIMAKHYWWCPAQTDAELLRQVVLKIKELYEKFI